MPWEGEGISPQSPNGEEYLQWNGLSAIRPLVKLKVGMHVTHGLDTGVQVEYFAKPRPPQGYMDDLEYEVQKMRKAWRDTL